MPFKLVSVLQPSSLNLRLDIQLVVVSPLQRSDLHPDLGVTAHAPIQPWPFQEQGPTTYPDTNAESSKASSLLLCPTSYPDPLHHPLG